MIADTLCRKLVPEDKIAASQQRIVQRLDNMLEWIGDTLNLSRVKGGEGLANHEVIDVGEVTTALAASYRERPWPRDCRFCSSRP